MKLLHRTPNAQHRGRPEDQLYGPGQLLAYGTQHILTMYGGVIAAVVHSRNWARSSMGMPSSSAITVKDNG